MQIKVSIIIATYNSEITIRDALESVHKQKFLDWECIVIDGASKDDTINIIKQYAFKDNRFRYISEPDKGVYYAFNKGWKIAKGEWIIYLGADDLLLDNALSTLLSYSKNSDLVYGNTILDFGKYRKKQVSMDYKVLNKFMCSCHQSIMMRKIVIEKLNGFDTNFKICADYDLVKRAYLSKYRFLKTDEYISSFYCGGKSSDSFKGIFEVCKINWKYAKNINIIIYNIFIYVKEFGIVLSHYIQNKIWKIF